MRTAGMPMNDIWSSRVLREHGIETDSGEALPAEIDVLVESVQLAHHGPEKNYRPYLHLSGELRSVRPASPLPYSIDEITYDTGAGSLVDAYYEFDDAQLVDLTQKGYFSGGFTVPEKIIGITWELPATIDTLVVAPKDSSDVPLVFVHVHESGDLRVDLSNSEYDLAAYFEAEPGREQVAPTTDSAELRVHTGPKNSLFVDLPEQSSTAQYIDRDAPVQEPVEDDLSTQIASIEKGLEADRERIEEERSRVPGSAAQIYAERVAEALNGSGDLPSRRSLREEQEHEEQEPKRVRQPMLDVFEDDKESEDELAL